MGRRGRRPQDWSPAPLKGISHEIAGGYSRNRCPADHPVGWLRSDHPAAACGATLAAEPALLSVHLECVVVAGAGGAVPKNPGTLSQVFSNPLPAFSAR